LLQKLESDKRYWIIAIDDLDYASSSAGSTQRHANYYQWVGLELPANVTFMATVTVMSGKDELVPFQKFIPAENHIEISVLSDKDIECFVEPNNSTTQQRSLSSKTRNLLNVMKVCPSPLFCRLLAENARRRPDLTQSAAVLGNSIESVISSRLAFLEERYGVMTTLAVLRYLTASPSGITELELLDVLSCNNAVMVHVINVTTAEQIRFPYVTWLRIKLELGEKLKHLSCRY
jgi:hypothetical protein